MSDALKRIHMQVMWNRLIAVVEEQAQALLHTAFGSITREAGDLSAGVYDTGGRMLAQAVTGTPGHVNTMAAAVRHFMDRFPIATMRPGDVFVMNDAFRGGIHANDLLILRPVFATPGGTPQVRWFAGTLIHVVDLGGVSAGGLAATATDVFAEGLQLPPVRLYDAGEPVPDMHRLLALNSRFPQRVMGDIEALVAGVNVLDLRTSELVERYGLDAFEAGLPLPEVGHRGRILAGPQAGLRRSAARRTASTMCW